MNAFNLKPLIFEGGKLYFHSYPVDWKKEEFERLLGKGKIVDNKWQTELDTEKAKSILNFALGTYIGQHLMSMTRRQLIWISSPPLIGHTAFGLIDRGTNVIQVRPISGCNLSCIFCSVDEGRNSKSRAVDFVVDCDVLLNEFEKLAAIKGKGVEAHIDGEGEPTYYHDLVKLVKGLKKIPNVKTVSMQSNGTLLTDKKIQALEEAGLDRINLSVHTLDADKAKQICGIQYSLSKVMRIAEVIEKSKIDLLIAPVWLPKITDEDIPKIITWANKLNAKIAVQNLLFNKFGRNLKKTVDFPKFYKKLEQWQTETGVDMVFGLKDLGVKKCKSLEKTMHKNEIVDAKIILPGRLKNSSIAVARNRLIQVTSPAELGSKVKLKITRDKQNIYCASIV